MSESDEEYGPPLPPGLSTTTPIGKNIDTSGVQTGMPSSSSAASQIGPVLPPGLANTSSYTSDSDADSNSSDDDSHKRTKSSSSRQKKAPECSGANIGPSLPPHLQHLGKSELQESSEEDGDTDNTGPSMPPHLKQLAGASASKTSRTDSDSDDDDIGPSLNLKSSGSDQSALIDFELRAQKMKAKLEGKEEVEDSGPQKRETWMTELPNVLGAQYGALENRQFRKKAAPEQDSSWTETPQEREQRKKEGASGKKRRKEESYLPTEEDLKAAKEIEKYNKKHRSKSLLEMHQKELKKKKKKEKKKNKDKVKERRPFDREADLQVNQLDDAKRRAIIKRSQDLGSRFKTGGTGTSFL